MLKNVPLPDPGALTNAAREYMEPSTPELFQAVNSVMAGFAADVMPLELDYLKTMARLKTGLNDFGDAPLDEPMAILCRSLNEIDFNGLGRVGVHQQLIGQFVTRLRLVDLWKKHPEILEQPIERPVFVLGLPRSGTTLMQRLLAQDPQWRSLPFWEDKFPLPMGAIERGDSDVSQRIELAEKALESAYWVAPQLIAMHEMQAAEPDEELNLTAMSHCSMQWEFMYPVSEYAQWFHSADHTEGYRFFRKVLQTLQWLRGGQRWMLKTSQHMEQLKPLLNVFPDATIVQTHRDPVTAVVSLASLTSYGSRQFFDHPDPLAIGQRVATFCETFLRQAVEHRPVDERAFVDVHFKQLVKDPLSVVRNIYAVAGAELTPEVEEQMHAWLAGNQQHKHGAHEYAAADFGLDVDQLRSRLDFYHKRFDVPVDAKFAGVRDTAGAAQ